MLPKRLSKRNRSFLKHIGVLMSAKGLAAVIALLLTPVIARLFDPSDFGRAAVWVSCCTILAHISSFKYEVAIMLPGDEEEAVSLYALAFRILLVFVAILGVVLLIPTIFGFGYARLGGDSEWLLWIVPGVFLLGVIAIQESWMARNKLFYPIGTSMIVGTLSTGSSRVLFGYLAGSSAIGLIGGQIVGQIARLSYQFWRNGRGIVDSSFALTTVSLKKIAFEYRDFPRLNMPASLVSSGAKNMPILLLGFLYGAEFAGFYAMAMRLAQSPLRLLTTSIRKIVYQRLAEISSKGRSLFRPYWMTCIGLALIGIVPTLAMVLFGSEALGYLLGPKWLQAGEYLQVIAPWLFTTLISVPVSPALNVIRRQELWLQLQIVSLVIRLLVFLGAYLLSFAPLSVITAFVVTVVLINISYVIFIGLFLRSQEI